jgi:hypothetical protein
MIGPAIILDLRTGGEMYRIFSEMSLLSCAGEVKDLVDEEQALHTLAACNDGSGHGV